MFRNGGLGFENGTAAGTGFLFPVGDVSDGVSLLAALVRHTKHDPQIAMLLPLTP